MTRDKESSFFKKPITRRQALKVMGAASAAGLMGVGVPGVLEAKPSGKQPNILFILSDDHRWDHLSIVGHTKLFLENLLLDRNLEQIDVLDCHTHLIGECSEKTAMFIRESETICFHRVENPQFAVFEFNFAGQDRTGLPMPVFEVFRKL